MNSKSGIAGIGLLALSVFSLPAQSPELVARALAQDVQASDTLHPVAGERIRFLAPSLVSGMQYASFRGVAGSELLVDPHNGDLRNWAIPLRQVERFEVRRGKGNSAAGKGAVIGMIVGGLLLGGGGYLAAGGSSNEYAGVAPLVLTPIGIGGGALVGSLIGRISSFQWVSVPLPLRSDSSRAR